MFIHCVGFVRHAGNYFIHFKRIRSLEMGFLFYTEMFFCGSSGSIQDQDKRLQALLTACKKLPLANGNNFK